MSRLVVVFVSLQVFTAASVAIAESCGAQYGFAVVSFRGPQSGCSENGGQCTTAETIWFTAVPLWNVSPACPISPSSFPLWDFGDNTSGNGLTTSHRYSFSMRYQVRVFLEGYPAGHLCCPLSGSAVVNVTGPRIQPNCEIQVFPSPLPAGRTGQLYSQVLSVSGGKQPYSFSILDGRLPPGLSMNQNAISGTPSTAGVFVFSVKIEDSQNCARTVGMGIFVESVLRRRAARPAL
jgi:hypothetical protein